MAVRTRMQRVRDESELNYRTVSEPDNSAPTQTADSNNRANFTTDAKLATRRRAVIQEIIMRITSPCKIVKREIKRQKLVRGINNAINFNVKADQRARSSVIDTLSRSTKVPLIGVLARCISSQKLFAALLTQSISLRRRFYIRPLHILARNPSRTFPPSAVVERLRALTDRS